RRPCALREAKLPAVVTVTKGAYEPRYPSLKGIMAAKRKPLEEKEAAVAESRLRIRELAYPPERPAGRIVGEGVEAVEELVRLLREEAKVLYGETMPKILAVAEQRDGALRNVSREVVAAARKVADALGGEVHALVLGPAGVGDGAGDLGRYGADKVWVGEDDAFGPQGEESV